MVDIFDEVNEELRAERAKSLLMRYGGFILAACVLVVAGAGGWQGWRWWQSRKDAEAAAQYVAAMAQAESVPGAGAADRAVAAVGFEALAASAPDGYRTLARLRAAALKADAGDLAGAAIYWDQVAGDKSADPLLRDLASLLWAQRQIDTGDPGLLEARLKPLTAPGNPWRAMALEQLALLDLRQGKTDAAKESLRKLSQDVTAPSGVRGRSGALLAQLGG